MKKHTFKKLKEEFIEMLRDKSPCAPEYKKVLESASELELLQIIYNNINWCIDEKAITNEFLNKFDPKNLLDSGLANTGKENTGFINSGYRNSGYRNSGYRNSGYRNSGYSNSGNWNSGDRNSGYRNSGYRNSGNWNSGYSNSGDSNSGNWNSGDSNSGNWNSGDRNSGDSNSGYRNSGAFCTDPDPVLYLFNKPSKMKVKEWENHRCCRLMGNVDPTIWVPFSHMTEQEKKDHPKAETTDGFLRTIPIKEAWTNAWNNFSEEDKKLFLSLENFDADVFFEITGVRV